MNEFNCLKNEYKNINHPFSEVLDVIYKNSNSLEYLIANIELTLNALKTDQENKKIQQKKMISYYEKEKSE
jgi:hypothetical protein